jgi:hypothetical protein
MFYKKNKHPAMKKKCRKFMTKARSPYTVAEELILPTAKELRLEI